MTDTFHVSDANFEDEVIKSSDPVVVDFFAEWCGPCKAMAPALDLVATEMKGKVKVVKVDVDKNPIITQKYSIQAMPTLILFHRGQIKARHSGAMVQKKRLAEWVSGAIIA